MSYPSTTAEMSLDSAHATEYLIKKEMITCMCSIQFSRAKGDKPNAGTKERYINLARSLHAILTGSPRKGYNDMHEMTVYSHNLYDTIEYDGHKSLLEIVEQLHETGNKPTVA